jgi:hypothetical protein
VSVISTKVSCGIGGIGTSGSPGLPNSAIGTRVLATRFSWSEEMIDDLNVNAHSEMRQKKIHENRSENACSSRKTRTISGRMIFRA